MKKKYLNLALFLASSFLGADEESANFFTQKYEECSIDPVVTRVETKHRENKGVGYDDGYTTLSTFIAPNISDHVMCFFDGRAHVLNDGNLASNLGLGFRLAALDKLAIGLNSYWDFRQVKHLPSHQVGAGLELLSPYADFRLNGYFPYGDKTYTNKAKFNSFRGNDIVFKQKTKSELTTVYSEIGAPIPGVFRTIDLYLATGPYYIFTRTVGLHKGKQDKTPAAWGGKLRASARVYDGLEVGMNVSYDHIFKWNVQGVISFSFPFGPANIRTKGQRWQKKFKGRCKDYGQLRALMNQPVERNEIIPILEKTFRKNLGVNCVFVNNNNPLPGNGTFENPFQNLQFTQTGSSPFDCIYVFQGNETYDTGFGGSAGFSFQTGQIMTGSGISFQLDGITVPPQTAGNPVITNPIGNALTIAEQATAQGLTVTGSANFGISAGSVGNFIIQNNIITGNGSHEIAGGLLSAMNPGTKVIRNNYIQSNNPDRVIWINDVPDGELLIFGNYIELLSQLTSGAVRVDTKVIDEINIVFRNNTIVGADAGTCVNIRELGASSSNSVAYITFQNNQLIGNHQNGLQVEDPASMTYLTVENNIIEASSSLLTIQTAAEDTKVAVIKNNTFLGGGSSQFTNFSPGDYCLDISGNTTPSIYNILNSGSTNDFRIKSTNGTSSGVELRNAPGSVFNFAGNPVTFIPVDAACLP